MTYLNRSVSIRPTSGQTVPVNAIGAVDFSPSGTYSLVDTGGGVMAWRVTASTTLPWSGGRLVNPSGGSGDPGVVLAMMVRESTTGTGVSNLRLCSVGNTSDLANTGLQVLRVSDGNVTTGWNGTGAPNVSGFSHSTLSCLVAKLSLNEAGDGFDRVRIWVGKSGRSGSTPDGVHAGGNFSGNTANAFLWATSGGHVEDHYRLDYWTNGDPTDAECAALADAGFASLSAYDAALAGDVTAPTITGPTGAAGAASISMSIAENTTAVGTWTANESVTWSKSGTDAALINISAGGVVTLAAGANFEAPTDAGGNNVLDFIVTATDTASPTPNVSNQTVALTITNANEAPTFGGTITVPGLVSGAAMTPINAATAFSDVDAGDAGTYSAIGTWPAGVTVSSVGVISGTPTIDGTYSGLAVRRTDVGALTADSNTFSITVSTPVLSGLDFDTAAGAIVCQLAGSMTNIAREVGAVVLVRIYNGTTGSLVAESGALTTDSAGRLARFEDAALVLGTTYDVILKRVSDGAIASGRMVAT